MTCIAGFVEGGQVWIGGDSAGVAGYSLCVRADEKVFRNGPMIFGFTSSFRMGQLLRYALTVPDRDADRDVRQWMVTAFVDAVRECLKAHGWASKTNEREEGGSFLVGYQGQLFCVQSDYQVGVARDGFDAVGCGDDAARGALVVTRHMRGKKRMLAVLGAAEACSAGVRGPFHIETLT